MVEEKIEAEYEKIHDIGQEILNRLTKEEQEKPEVVLALLDLHYFLRGKNGLEIPEEIYKHYRDKYKKTFEKEKVEK